MYLRPKFNAWLFLKEGLKPGTTDWRLLFEVSSGKRTLYGWTATSRKRATIEAVCVALDLTGGMSALYIRGCDDETLPLLTNFRKSFLYKSNFKDSSYCEDFDLWEVYGRKKTGNRVHCAGAGLAGYISTPSFKGMKVIPIDSVYTAENHPLPNWLKY